MTLVYRRDGKLPTAAQGQKRRFDNRPVTSGLPPTSDIADSASHVRFVPNSEVVRFGVATLIHDVGAPPQFHIGRPEN
jgi:hypothetical protein